jgi:glycosyltransferase involved in cell wall biosynthesis
MVPSPSPSVVYVLPDKLGGMMNVAANLLACRRADGLEYYVVLTHNSLSGDTRFGQPLRADRQVTIEYTLPLENLHAVLHRLAAAIPPGPGVLVSNDLIELAMLSCYDPGRTVIQMLHGDHDYYYDLAVRHEPVIDVFIAISRAIYDTLRLRLPHRHDSIVHLPFGVPIPTTARTPAPGKLRLIYAGRIENQQKGVFDLPEIDRHLQDLGCSVEWTLVGGGPDEAALRRRWGAQPHVRWLGPATNAEVVGLYAEQDVFVLPTRAEGFSLALIEAMGAGLVPVVSDIASGVREVVTDGVTGFRLAVADVAAFAAAITILNRNRDRLEVMSRAARQVVVEDFDIRERVASYQALYARWREYDSRRPRALRLPYGSRLDQPWLPNALVYTLRATRRWLAGTGRR